MPVGDDEVVAPRPHLLVLGDQELQPLNATAPRAFADAVEGRLAAMLLSFELLVRLAEEHFVLGEPPGALVAFIRRHREVSVRKRATRLELATLRD